MSQAYNMSSLELRSGENFAGLLCVRGQSSFESMTLTAGEAPATESDLIGALLAATLPVADLGCEVLRPLWAEEALHRAYSFIRLIDARSPPRSGGRGRHTIAKPEGIAVSDLALRFNELETAEERAVLPCAKVLRDVVTSIGTLFCRPIDINLAIRIDCVPLPGYQRRALVLAATELLNNALLHAFPGNAGGRIEIELSRDTETSARLSVADDGIGFTDRLPNLTCGLAAGLADLLEADLAYDRIAGWTIAKITFPVAALGSCIDEQVARAIA